MPRSLSGPGHFYATMLYMNIDEVLDKWSDALSVADSWEEKNLISEFLDDLKDLGHARG